MSDPVVLQLHQVLKQFSATQIAVDQVTLTLHQGELLGLLGPSGCGKTTLLRLIAGFERPQAGTIELDGQVVASARLCLPPEQRDVGMVFQDYALFPHLTVAKNVAFGLQHRARRSRKYSPQQVQQLIQEALALVGLQGLEQRFPHELSGGQQQRVALARALAPRPALMLLDEPLSNLDAQVRIRLRQEIRDILKKTGTSGVFVTHDQEEALSISDWVAVMRQGRLEQFGRPEALYAEPVSRFIAGFVSQANFLPAQRQGEVWKTEVGCFGIQVQTLDLDQGDLMVRQEDLRLQPDETGAVVIRDRQFLGREHRYCLLTPSGRELHARTPVSQVLPIGSRVALLLPESGVKLFPSEAS